MDTYRTQQGPLHIERLGHASLLFTWNGYTIYVDPYSEVAAFDRLPQADLILITHDHYDHFDPKAISPLLKANTQLIVPPGISRIGKNTTTLRNGEQQEWNGIQIKATPAYNLIGMRTPGVPFHPQGEGNGYLLEIAPLRIYIAGDTELIPEMESLGTIDIAFLPKNLPYTMSDEMFIEAAKLIHPTILYAYHYDTFNIGRLRHALPNVTLK